MKGQIHMLDWMPTFQAEPEVGTRVTECGAVIPHIMIRSYIGKKIAFDVSTQSRRLFQVGRLEKVLDTVYYHLEGEAYKERPCSRVVIYTGKKDRSYLSLIPGTNVFEVLPWDAYPERMKAIGGRS